MNRTKLRGICVCLFTCLVLLLTFVCPDPVQAATPRVMMWGYSVTEGEIYAGEEFELSLVLRNTATTAVKNVKLTISTEQGEFLPVDGAGTAYAAKIGGQQEEAFTFKLEAIHGLAEKSYKLKLKTEYEGNDGTGYTVEEEIFLPVSLKQRLSVTDVFIPESDIQLGDTVEVGASVNNLGDGTLYHVSAHLSGDNIEEAISYIGNIDAGKQGNIDILTKATAVSEMGNKNKLTITYEDQKGNQQEETYEISVLVAQPSYENLEKVKEAPNYGKIWTRIILVAVGVLLIAGITIGIIRKRKRKQKMLEEF